MHLRAVLLSLSLVYVMRNASELYMSCIALYHRCKEYFALKIHLVIVLGNFKQSDNSDSFGSNIRIVRTNQKSKNSDIEFQNLYKIGQKFKKCSIFHSMHAIFAVILLVSGLKAYF